VDTFGLCSCADPVGVSALDAVGYACDHTQT
jgi:hypothetical protein